MRAVIAAALLALAAPGAAEAAELAGAWTVKADFGPQFRYTLTCLLQGDAQQRLAGPCVAILGRPLRAVGSVTGNHMRFAYDTDYNGSGVHLIYEGKRQADGSVDGTVSSGPSSSGMFQARTLMSFPADNVDALTLEVAFSPELKYAVLCAFKSPGARVAGPCGVIQGPTLQASGTADGAHVTFGYDTVYQGRSTHVDYDGALQADGSLKGAVRADGATGSFTAARP